MKKLFKTSSLMLIFFLLFTAVSAIFPGKGPSETLKILLTISSFLFGIFVAFSINNSNARFNKIAEALKSDEASLLFLYKISAIFGSKVTDDLQKLIDNYLTEQIDYYLVDFDRSNKSFLKIMDYVINEIKPPHDNKQQEIAYKEILSSLSTSLKNRKQVEVWIKQPMQKFEWISTLALLSIILFCIFYLNDGTLISITTSILLSTAAVIVVLILRDLNSLRWKENAWVWDDLTQLFQELDLLPYFPKVILNSEKFNLEKGQKIRTVTYPHPYPDFKDKKVEIIEV